jgi:hypothetical protein
MEPFIQQQARRIFRKTRIRKSSSWTTSLGIVTAGTTDLGTGAACLTEFYSDFQEEQSIRTNEGKCVDITYYFFIYPTLYDVLILSLHMQQPMIVPQIIMNIHYHDRTIDNQ